MGHMHIILTESLKNIITFYDSFNILTTGIFKRR